MEARRALVLGSGGAAGIAWHAGVLAGLAEGGAGVADADQIIGTSAGALVGAHLALGRTPAELLEFAAEPKSPLGRLSPLVVGRLIAAQLWPSRRHAVLWLGRGALRRNRSRLSESDWVARFAPGLAGLPWPERLVVVALGVETGRPAYFTARSGVDLARAVAASCAVPGVFPPVEIAGRRYFDGGLRSPANIDAALGADVIVALAPLTTAVRAHRRPEHQAGAMRDSARVVLITPDTVSLRAFGLDPLDSRRNRAAAEAGRTQGAAWAARVREVWDVTPVE